MSKESDENKLAEDSKPDDQPEASADSVQSGKDVEAKKTSEASGKKKQNEWEEQVESLDLQKDAALILEDSLPNRNILKAILERHGIQTLVAKNGVEGQTLLELCQSKNVNLIIVISDMMMPEMDGMEFLEVLRRHDKFKGLPFFFVTAVSNKENVTQAARLGINGYLLKPISMDQIKEKLKSLFPGRVFIPIKKTKKSA